MIALEVQHIANTTRGLGMYTRRRQSGAMEGLSATVEPGTRDPMPSGSTPRGSSPKQAVVLVAESLHAKR